MPVNHNGTIKGTEISLYHRIDIAEGVYCANVLWQSVKLSTSTLYERIVGWCVNWELLHGSPYFFTEVALESSAGGF